MKKTRADSIWAGISAEQQAVLEGWLFDENLTYREAVERAEKELGVKGSIQSMARFYKKAQTERALRRLNAAKIGSGEITGQNSDKVEGATLKLLGVSAYELALAGPEKLKLNELSWLMKVQMQYRRQVLRERQFAMNEQKFQIQGYRDMFEHAREMKREQQGESEEDLMKTLHLLRKELFNEGPDGKKLRPENAAAKTGEETDAEGAKSQTKKAGE